MDSENDYWDLGSEIHEEVLSLQYAVFHKLVEHVSGRVFTWTNTPYLPGTILPST